MTGDLCGEVVGLHLLSGRPAFQKPCATVRAVASPGDEQCVAVSFCPYFGAAAAGGVGGTGREADHIFKRDCEQGSVCRQRFGHENLPHGRRVGLPELSGGLPDEAVVSCSYVGFLGLMPYIPVGSLCRAGCGAARCQQQDQ